MTNPLNAPRRRAEDWKATSPIRLSAAWFSEIAERLGYDPVRVMSVRLNKTEAVVTFREPDGMPRSIRHELATDG